MQDELIIKRASELLESGEVNRVLAWRCGEFGYDVSPFVFRSAEDLKKNMVFNDFCAPNLCKYLISETKEEGKILMVAKPCDTYGINQLVKEHRIDRDKVYVLGVECYGKIDADTLLRKIPGISSVKENEYDIEVETLYGKSETLKKWDVYGDRCKTCKSKKHVTYDELIGEDGDVVPECGRFDEVERLEAMTPDERFEFWRSELSKCIRCNACRNVCPVCNCTKCIFDNDASGIAAKANTDSFEENMFHIIRAFHVAGRCTDCGECSRVCPQNIPLHLLNRKFIKDINSFYGDYMAGEDSTSRGPLTDFRKDDADPSVVSDKGGAR